MLRDIFRNPHVGDIAKQGEEYIKVLAVEGFNRIKVESEIESVKTVRFYSSEEWRRLEGDYKVILQVERNPYTHPRPRDMYMSEFGDMMIVNRVEDGTVYIDNLIPGRQPRQSEMTLERFESHFRGNPLLYAYED